VGVISSNPKAGHPEADPLERDCLAVLAFDFSVALGVLAGGRIVSETPRLVGNFAIDREVGTPVLLFVPGRIVSGMIRLVLF